MIYEKKTGGKPFQFKQFSIAQDKCAMKVGTDGVLLGAWANAVEAQKILDIGTGTGVIAIMIAQKIKDGIVHAVEIDEAAYLQARENVAQSPFLERLAVFHDSIQDYAKMCEERYDLIVSNPPFFTGGTFSLNQDKTNVRHTVKLSHGDLLQSSRQLLRTDGRFCVILPMLEGLRFIEVARNYHLYCTKVTEVIPKAGKGVERLLIQLELTEKVVERDQLIIQHEDRNDFTEGYKNLTRAFYTIF